MYWKIKVSTELYRIFINTTIDCVLALRNELKSSKSKALYDKDVPTLRLFIDMDVSCFDAITLYDSAVIKGLSFQAIKKFRPFVNMFSEKLSRWCWCRDDRNKTFCLLESFFRISLTSAFLDFPMAFVRPIQIGLSSRYQDEFVAVRGERNPYNNVYNTAKLSIFELREELYKTGPRSVAGDHIASEGDRHYHLTSTHCVDYQEEVSEWCLSIP